MRDTWHHYFALVDLSKKMENLEAALKSERQKNVELGELRQENLRLVKIFKLEPQSYPKKIVARVVGNDPSLEFKTVRINKGKVDGVRSDMPVVVPEGLVGRVGPVYKKEAIVLLLVDPSHYVDVLVQRSRLRGLLRGSGFVQQADLQSSALLSRLEYLERGSDVQEKDRLITSGLDRLYPKGIYVGDVEKVERSRFQLFTNALVVPSVDFTKLEEVIVLR